MFSIVFASLALSLGFGISAVEFPEMQNVMLVGACLAATAFCGSFEAWSCQDIPSAGAPLGRRHANEEPD
jgi:hypothetical protein